MSVPGTRHRARARLFTLAAAVLIGALTLTPSSDVGGIPFCLSCAFRDRSLGADLVLNVVLFAPLGAGLVASGLSTRRAALIALGASIVIELLQATVIPGRFASFTDIVANTTGGFAGALLATR